MFVNLVLVLSGTMVGASLSTQEKSLSQAKNYMPRIQLHKIKVKYTKLKYTEHDFMKEKRNLDFKRYKYVIQISGLVVFSVSSSLFKNAKSLLYLFLLSRGGSRLQIRLRQSFLIQDPSN